VPAALKPVVPGSPYGLSFDGDSFVEMASPVEADELTISAWVYSTPGVAGSMKTIVSNRLAGCEVDPERYGYALIINQWGTDDRSLVLNWGNAMSGCLKLNSDDGVLPVNQWKFVTATMSAAAREARLYVDGVQVASTSTFERSLQVQHLSCHLCLSVSLSPSLPLSLPLSHFRPSLTQGSVQ
jgi:hypothetical protein